jgi:hypothetical protein
LTKNKDSFTIISGGAILEEYQEDAKKGKPKWMLWAIIGVAVIVVVVVMAMQLGREPSSAAGLTLDDLSLTVTSIVSWKATAIEDIANLKSKDTSLQTQIDAITRPKDWTSDINKLKEEWASVNQTLADAMAGLNSAYPRYAMVSGMEEKLTGIYIDISVYGVGSYPILVSFYGQNLEEDTVSVKPRSGYIITKEYSFYDLGMNATRRDFVILPTDGWESTNLVQMKAVGEATLSYAFAVVGDSWAKAEEEW